VFRMTPQEQRQWVINNPHNCYLRDPLGSDKEFWEALYARGAIPEEWINHVRRWTIITVEAVSSYPGVLTAASMSLYKEWYTRAEKLAKELCEAIGDQAKSRWWDMPLWSEVNTSQHGVNPENFWNITHSNYDWTINTLNKANVRSVCNAMDEHEVYFIFHGTRLALLVPQNQISSWVMDRLETEWRPPHPSLGNVGSAYCENPVNFPTKGQNHLIWKSMDGRKVQPAEKLFRIG
jgi:hypothetical protein